MTPMQFDEIARRIRHDKGSHSRDWVRDGKIWVDPQGNWYGWVRGGSVEELFYAGEKWVKTYSGKKEKIKKSKISALDKSYCLW